MNGNNHFKFKLNNFHSNLESGFYDLLKNEEMVDVTLVTNEKILKAHKTVLAISSLYFQDIFKNHPCKHPIVILKDVGAEEMGNMLDFMYTGEANVQQGNLASFIKLGEILKVKDLIEEKKEKEKVETCLPKASEKLTEVTVCKKKSDILVIELDDNDSVDFNDNEVQEKESCDVNNTIESHMEVTPKVQADTIASQKEPVNSNTEDEVLKDNNDEISKPLVDINFHKDVNQKCNDDLKISPGCSSHEMECEKTAGIFNNEEESIQSASPRVWNQEPDLEPGLEPGVWNQKPNQDGFESDALKISPGFSLHEIGYEKSAKIYKNQEEYTKTALKRGKGPGRLGIIWEFFERHNNNSVCKECGTTYKGYQASYCKVHLKNKHPNSYKLFKAKTRENDN